MQTFVNLFKYIGIFILCWLFFVPEEMIKRVIPFYTFGHNILNLLICLAIIFLCVLNIKSYKLITKWICIYSVAVIAITFVQGGNFSYTLIMYSKIMAISLAIDWILKNKDFVSIKAISFSLNVLIVINLLGILMGWGIFAGNYGNNFLLGFDNGNVLVILPAMILNYVICYIEKNDKLCLRKIFTWILTIISVISINSATTTVGLIVFILLLVVEKFDVLKVINRKALMLGIVVLFVSINILNMQSIFSQMIVDMLGKDLTFTGRVRLWEIALQGFFGAPILGHGIDPEVQRAVFLGVSSAHNQILDILYQTGIVGLILFLAIMVQYIKGERENSYLGKYIDFMIFAFSLMMMFESYNSYITFGLVFVLLVIAQCKDELLAMRNSISIKTVVLKIGKFKLT